MKGRMARLVGKAALVFVAVWVVLAMAVAGGLWWLAVTHPKTNPLNLQPFLPRIERTVEALGVKLVVGRLEVFYDGSPVVRAEDIQLLSPDGVLGVVVEESAFRLAKRSLFWGKLAPKVVEARGVTLRIIQKNRVLSVAGLDVGQGAGGGTARVSAVGMLNGLSANVWLGRLKTVAMERVTLLYADQDRGREWVVEDAVVQLSRYEDNGDHGTLTATLRRLDEGGAAIPLVVAFDHNPGASYAEVKARFERADAVVLADYLPPALTDLVRAKGEVELSTTLDDHSRVGIPWVTLRLGRVVLTPPKAYSAPLVFSRLTLAASYEPLPTDVLTVRHLDVETDDGLVLWAKGRILNVTGDPVFNLDFESPGGNVASVFKLLPDIGVKTGAQEAWLIWLKENITGARFGALKGSYRGRPSDFPHCDTRCGLVIDAPVGEGQVRFLEALPPAKDFSGTFHMGGGGLVVKAPLGKVGEQVVRDIRVEVRQIFTPSPTIVDVSGTLVGEVKPLMSHLAKLDKSLILPMVLEGHHETRMGIEVPILPHRDTRMDEIGLDVHGAITRGKVSALDVLEGRVYAVDKAWVDIAQGRLRVVTQGSVDGNKVGFRLDDRLVSGTTQTMDMSGSVPAAWLTDRLGKPKGLTLAGSVAVHAAVSQTTGGWAYDVKADGAPMRVQFAPLNLTKKPGEALMVAAKGVLLDETKDMPKGLLKVESAAWSGVWQGQGTAVLDLGRVLRSTVHAQNVRLGRTAGNVDYADNKGVLVGAGLDLSGMDLFEDEDKPGKPLEDMNLKLDVGRLWMKEGTFGGVKAQLASRNGVWDIDQFVAQGNGHSSVAITAKGDASKGKRVLHVDIRDLGGTLAALGLYERLRSGHLVGDIHYTSRDVGAGTLTMDSFELRNSPVFVKLLGLLSLQQILAGTDTTLFDKAVIPLKINKSVVTLDNALFEGPSVSLRLSGDYERTRKTLDMNGSLAPAIPFNRLVTMVPLVGRLLAGSQDGVVVADFRLKGLAADPEISVSPLSVIMPGLLKDAWRGIFGK